MEFIIEKFFSESEVTECRHLYNKLVQTHELCQGSGMLLEGDQIRDCECEAVFKYVKQLIYSQIPRRYWFANFKKIDALLVTNEERKLIKDMIKKQKVSQSMLICGKSVSGKTSLLSIIGKIGIWFNQIVVYTTVEDFLDMLRKDSPEHKLYLDRIMGAQILLIDNTTLFKSTEWAQNQLEHYLKKFYDNGMQLIFALDKPSDQLESIFSDGLFQFINKIATVLVASYEGRQDLEIQDYMSSPLMDEAKKYFSAILS